MPLSRDASLWFNMAGALAVYQPVRAPGPLLARYNMRYGGNNAFPATPGTAPTWSPITGWTFDGFTQYLNTGIVHLGNTTTWSMIVRVKFLGNPTQVIAGVGRNEGYFRIFERAGGLPYYGNGNQAAGAAISETFSGILGIAGLQGYRDGLTDGSAIAAGANPLNKSIYIGCSHQEDDGAGFFSNCAVRALVICARQLSAAEMWTASRQMAYCDVNPEWSAWARRRQWYISPQVAGFQAAWAARNNRLLGGGVN